MGVHLHPHKNSSTKIIAKTFRKNEPPRRKGWRTTLVHTKPFYSRRMGGLSWNLLPRAKVKINSNKFRFLLIVVLYFLRQAMSLHTPDMLEQWEQSFGNHIARQTFFDPFHDYPGTYYVTCSHCGQNMCIGMTDNRHISMPEEILDYLNSTLVEDLDKHAAEHTAHTKKTKKNTERKLMFAKNNFFN